MPGAESENHSRLKALALAWAQANGFAICGLEVRVPRSGYRADLAAASRGASARTAVFECKQGRGDLLKDAHSEAVTRAQLNELTQRRRTLEELLAVHRQQYGRSMMRGISPRSNIEPIAACWRSLKPCSDACCGG